MSIKSRTCLRKARFICKFEWFSGVVEGGDGEGGKESCHDGGLFWV